MGKIPSFLLSEVAGKIFITVGIICEIAVGTDFYLILITVGSLLISVGVELRTYRKGGEKDG